MTGLKLFLAAGLLLLAGTAHAGLYIEPALTYEKGDSTLQWPSPLDSSTGSTSGVGFDLKFGWDFDGIVFLGADGEFSKPTFKNSAVNYSAAANSNLLGVVVGGQMPIVGLRIWGGYILDGTLDPDASNGWDVKFSGANGYKLGAGFHILMVSLNLEYLDLQYNSSTLEAAGPISLNSNLDGKLKNKLWIVSVSIPMTL